MVVADDDLSGEGLGGEGGEEGEDKGGLHDGWVRTGLRL